ncbi:Hypothetical predicted protein [Mytilus galloprovincialis]|uniref:Endonuclease/exonuclease/phosphatase domain-containing protein n=1 Tax=Mytilus galloprovincialis TaxID=29158 RepID=A0A8B6FP48_MYTGA|nr:Hypothetical predicted protein [Mytilus galloprovincialis]
MALQLSLAHWNCLGIRSYIPEFIWHLNNIKDTPNILCFQETFCIFEKDYLEIPGYTLATFSSRGVNRGGTAIYVKKYINYSTVDFQSTFETSAIYFIHNSKKFLILNLYDPKLDTKYEDYDALLSQITTENILCGDFNAHHTLWGKRIDTYKGRELFKCIQDNNICLLNEGSGTRLNPIN